MKVVVVLKLCSLAAAAVMPKVAKPRHVELNTLANYTEDRSKLLDQALNELLRQLNEYVRRVIKNGSFVFGIPTLDPLNLKNYHLFVPAGFLSMDLDLKNICAMGLGGFVVYKNHLDLIDLTFDLDISVPSLDVSAEQYILVGGFLAAIPLYGKGKAVFRVDGLRFQSKFFLKQSENKRSVLISHVENITFQLPFFKSQLTGMIGGREIDSDINTIIEEVIVDYIEKFQGYIVSAISKAIPAALNPILDQLDTWKYFSFYAFSHITV